MEREARSRQIEFTNKHPDFFILSKHPIFELVNQDVNHKSGENVTIGVWDFFPKESSVIAYLRNNPNEFNVKNIDVLKTKDDFGSINHGLFVAGIISSTTPHKKV